MTNELEVVEDVMNEGTNEMEQKAMQEMDELVELFRGRATKERLMKREHDRMLQMVRNQKEKIQVLQMRLDHVNTLLSQTQDKAAHAPTEEHRLVMKDHCNALMNELRHLQSALERNQMMLARYENEAKSQAISLESMHLSQRRTRQKAEAINQEAKAMEDVNESRDRQRADVLNVLMEKLAKVDTATLMKIERLIEPQAVVDDGYGKDEALAAIEPKIRLIRESNLYGLLKEEKKARIDTIIHDYESRIRDCSDARLLKHYVNDFEKIAFTRIFRKMAESIE